MTVSPWYHKKSDSVRAESLQLLLNCRTHKRCLLPQETDFRTFLHAAGVLRNRSMDVK